VKPTLKPTLEMLAARERVRLKRAARRIQNAAPDLLSALRGMLSLVAGTSAEDEQPCEDARAAIIKATGET